MNVKIVSLHWQNMNDRIVWGQRKVFNKFNIPITQHCIDGLDHADWMQWVTDTTTNTPLILFVDVDCIITDQNKASDWVQKAANGALVGNIQSTNHLGPEVAKKTFAAPSFMVLNKNVYEGLGKPSFKATPYGDVAQLLTDTWRMRQVPVHLIPITHFEKPKWALAGVPDSYGIGTTFGDCNYHLFESRNNDNIDMFCRKVEEVIKK
jgi:hypothetical protein